MPTPTPHENLANPSRRAALKKGAVGAVVAGAVWNAPQITGLSIRPRYAAAQSGGAMMGSGSTGPVPLPDEINIDIDLPFTGLAMSITEVTLVLDITHTWIGDMVITLTSPQGTSLLLMDDECVGASTGMLITLDDDAAADVGTGCSNPSLYTGTFRPIQALSGFDGEDPNGTWVLNITDDQGADSGDLNDAVLTIEAM